MHLNNLPPEILQIVVRELDYATRLALSLTSHSFNTLARPLKGSTPGIKYEMQDLLTIERWPTYDRVGTWDTEGHMGQPLAGLDYFACSSCLRIRDAIHYTNAMMRGKKGKHGSRTEAGRRMCIDCLVRKGAFTQVGKVVQFGGARVGGGVGGGDGIFCGGCRGFKRVGWEYREREHCDDCESAKAASRS